MRRCHFILVAASLALGLSSLKAANFPKTIVIKADDVTSVAPKWQKFFEVSQEEGVKVTAGLVGKSFQKGGQPYAQWLLDWEKTGLVEFWHHGWDHARWETEGKKLSEFGGSGYPHQKEHLIRTQNDARQFLKKPFSTFGSPFNAMDEDTMKALNELPEIQRIFIYPNHAQEKLLAPDKILLPMHLVGENDGVGKPNFELFKADYAKRISRGFQLSALQFHPGMFTETHLAEYRKILQFLKSEGWSFALAKEIENPN